jgi:alanine or glycine:cation symporter, AGCS family
MLDQMLASLSTVIDRFSGTVFFKIGLLGGQVEAVILWLAIPMVLFTFWLGFPQLRAFSHALRLVRGDYDKAHAKGAVSHFAALATAISGTVGMGNIAGVALGVAVGGPGAAFWMLVIGFFAMALKCAEVTMGLKFRKTLADGSVVGGPFYALQFGMESLGMARTGKLLAVFYAICLLFGCLSLFQVNQSYTQVANMTGFTYAWGYGILFAILVGVVIIGDIKWIARFTTILSPAKAGIYIIGCLCVLGVNYQNIGSAIALIFTEAFNLKSVWGGAIAAFVMGMRRATYACEAGVGTAVIAHAAAKTDEPASEGLVAMLETFLCIFIICALSALTVITAGTWTSGQPGIEMTSAAFGTVSPWFQYVLTVAVFLFAYSTVIANGYYGAQSWCYLFGETRRNDITFKIIFCCIQPLGAALPVSKVIDFVDAVYFLMAIPNVIGLYFLAPVIRQELTRYLADVKSGKLAPTR